jgi:hypothetical protein
VRRRAAAALAACVLAWAAGGCGAEAADLFLVTRSGSIPGARLTVRVTDDGRASCNGRALVNISSAELVTARAAQRDLERPAKNHLRLAPAPGSVLSYRVRTEDGTVAWSDSSRRQPQVLFVLAKLTRDVARGPCGLPR